MLRSIVSSDFNVFVFFGLFVSERNSAEYVAVAYFECVHEFNVFCIIANTALIIAILSIHSLINFSDLPF